MLQNMPADLDLHVTLLGKELCLVVSVKDLGVHMDATMSFDEHNYHKYYIFLLVKFKSN